jgi:hypothetical protein
VHNAAHMRTEVSHPLRKAAIRPSSSTLRGMLSPKEFKIVDSALQSLRSAGGLELQWEWRGKSIGWICAAKYNDFTVCEVHAASIPIKGIIQIPMAISLRIQESPSFPEGFKGFLKHPTDTCGSNNLYSLEIETTELRDLLSDLVSEILNYID